MRFTFAIAVVAVLISATEAVSDSCPVCFIDHQCRHCDLRPFCNFFKCSQNSS